jgi:hypothetical protein
MARLTHADCHDAFASPGFMGHASVTELEICSELRAEDMERAAEIYAENAWLRYAEGGWDPTGAYAAESLLTAGGLPAYNDPQAW